MPETTLPKFDFDLGDYGGTVAIGSPDELRKWTTDEWNAWAWITQTGQPSMDNIIRHHQQFQQRVQHFANAWANVLSQPQQIENVLNQLANHFQEYYCKRLMFHSSSVEAAFLSQLREKKGVIAAGGAYAALLANQFPGSINHPAFLEGMLEGFLYRQEIDWGGSAHSEILNQLRKHYESNIAEQERRIKELDTQNASLNTAFGEILKERSAVLQKLETDRIGSFDKLHEDQSASFSNVIKKHEDNLKAIEQTYDQKLALQKPVDYWAKEEKIHKKQARNYGIAAGVMLVVLVCSLGVSIYKVLGNLKPDENPKHWQVGLLLVALFFSIWVMRILVRLFLSHLHLAGDAAERRTMILTFLSMAREGAQFAPTDKTLILQHLFRSASDGLVKDDAAPPTPMEWLSRK